MEYYAKIVVYREAKKDFGKEIAKQAFDELAPGKPNDMLWRWPRKLKEIRLELQKLITPAEIIGSDLSKKYSSQIEYEDCLWLEFSKIVKHARIEEINSPTILDLIAGILESGI